MARCFIFGYAFSVLVAMYVKNKMKDYKFDVGVLGAVIFGVGGASDAVWHTYLVSKQV